MAQPGFTVPQTCLITGGSGFVGHRLCEILVERGAKRVVAFDIVKPKNPSSSEKIHYILGDITNKESLIEACKDIDCVFHIAALVGPYHEKRKYEVVNYQGTANVLEACRVNNIKKIVMSSSPSTRFPYPDPNIDGLTEQDLREINKGEYSPKFLQPYAETKAMGEKLIRDACGRNEGELLTIAVAPHQVYGPHDTLFLPSLLSTAATGRLRIFGSGENRISFCHVDNYCHGLILGAEALYPGSPALGNYYVVTDGPPIYFWKVLDQAVVAMGFQSLFQKFKLPTAFMMFIAHLTVFIGNLYATLTNTPQHVVNKNLKLNPFAVKMLVINRYFDISAAKKDLHYEPLLSFEQGWAQTIEWFKENWLPEYQKSTRKD